MARRRVKGIAFDMYGTVVDVGGVAEACRDLAPDPLAFAGLWRGKQLEYTFLRSLMGRYRDFWKVSRHALDFAIERFGLQLDGAERARLLRAWLHPRAYPDVARALARLQPRYPLAILSNGSPRMLRTGLGRAGLLPYFRWVISADEVQAYKPSPRVYRLAVRRMRLTKEEILLVSSNAFDVAGARSFGLSVCWINRAGAPFDRLGPRPDLVVGGFDELVAALG